MILYYIRHGAPTYNPDALTPLGHAQAQAVAKRLLLYGIDEVYASTSNRAIQTAQPLCDLLGKKMTLCDWANEGQAWKYFTVPLENGTRTWGFDHRPTIEKFVSPAVRALGEKWYTHPDFSDLPFAQGVAFIDRETDAFLLSLGYRHDREHACYEVVEKNPRRIALFAHQGMGMCFLSSLLDIPYPTYCTHFDMGHSGVTVIHFDDRHPTVIPRALQVANDSHLYREGILTGYKNSINI